MKGLLRNNFYMALANTKVFASITVLLGLFVIVMDNEIPSLIIGYMLSVMIGSSFVSITGLRKESAAKWSKYKLTAPVKRADIVSSLFISQLIWLGTGAAFAGICAALSIAIHGYPFDRDTDIFMLFVVGIGISLFMGAIFFPLFFWGGEERNEIILGISLFCGIGIIMGLSSLINSFFPAGMTPFQVILSGAGILVCGILAFIISCPLTVLVFQKKEY